MSAPPDRSAFVSYAREKFAAVESMVLFFETVDAIRAKRWQMRIEGNGLADGEIALAARAAYERLGGQV